MAWQHAGLDKFADLDKTRTGIYLGGGEGPFDFDNFATAAVGCLGRRPRATSTCRKWAELAYQQLDADRELEQEPTWPSGHIAGQFGLEGPASTR